MLLPPDVATAYLDHVLAEMLRTLGRFRDDELTVAPFGPATTSAAGLVTHSTEVCGYWLQHVGLGEPRHRDRAAEFTHHADRPELEQRIAAARDAVPRLVGRLDAGEGQPSELRAIIHGDQGDASIVLHVLEELYQHLGHLELTADVLEARRVP